MTMARKRALLAARSGTTIDGKPLLGHQTASVGKMTARAAKAVHAATITAAASTASATTSSASSSATAASSVSSLDEIDNDRGVQSPSASSRYATKRASKSFLQAVALSDTTGRGPRRRSGHGGRRASPGRRGRRGFIFTAGYTEPTRTARPRCWSRISYERLRAVLYR
ncbi:hypothetical protein CAUPRSCDRAFT_13001 [Caulochytrium protostelioides]|uniref:Uncharacterized protein n=1 Tax=Caulochytrium protostelioides TaxID=1555241 RepID=A0A4P9WQ63_9FUNG|nr:hypothetical protein CAUPRSCDRAFT_13001 [Caulochytrium protostelioides]